MKIIDVIQRSKEWHDWRGCGISASEISVFLNESPYQTPWKLWAIKVGKLEREDLSRNPMVNNGKRSEDRLREYLEDKHNFFLLPLCAEYDENPIFRASLDGYSDNDEPWELKWPSEKVWMEVSLFGINSTAYKLYRNQVLHQMLVTGSKKGYLAFGHDGNNGVEAKVFDIDWDDKKINLILETGIKFWNMIKNRNEPPKDIERDFYEPTDSDRVTWDLLADKARNIEAEIKPLKNEIERLEELKGEIKTEALNIMGEYKRGKHNGLDVLRSLRIGSIDYKRLIESVDELDEEKLESFRGKGSISVRMTVSDPISLPDITPVVAKPEVILQLENTGTDSDFF
jgi:putative phage-type endonuclease